jgi:F-type H+-transporting ATPase subunit epsilon
MGILPNHAALVSTLTAGELRYTKDSKTHDFAIGAGFAEITGDRVNVLTEMAVRDSDIDESAVQAALDRAQARLKEDVLPEETTAIEAAIANSMAQLHLKRKRRAI